MESIIREATTDADMERWLSVRNAVDPRPMTLAGLRAERTAVHAGLDLIATIDDTTIGAGFVGWSLMGAESKSAHLDLWVLPDHRRMRTGGRMFDRLVSFARDQGMMRLTSAVLEGDAASLAFALGRGLTIEGGGSLGSLDLNSPAAIFEDQPIQGIDVVTYADRPDLEGELYALDRLVQPEIPYIADQPQPSFEAWQGVLTNDPGFLPDLSLIALGADRVVGHTHIFDNADATIFIGMTAVHPDARRRGIARHLKVELARRARAAGVRRIETYNDGTNARIRGLNESLGYVYDPTFLVLRGPLPG